MYENADVTEFNICVFIFVTYCTCIYTLQKNKNILQKAKKQEKTSGFCACVRKIKQKKP